MRTLILTAILLASCTDEPGDTGPTPDDTGGDTAGEYVIGPAGDVERELDVDGVTRFFQLFVPEEATSAMAGGPVPLLIALHGAGDEGDNFISATRLTSLAEDNAFVLVGPDAIRNAWFLSEEEGWGERDGNPSSLQNDLLLLEHIVDTVRAEYRIDTGRVYAVGHSRGAGLSALLAILSGQYDHAEGTFASPFTALGVNAGYDPTGGAIDPAPASPKSAVWVIHGSSDRVVPPSYGEDLADALLAAGFDVEWTEVAGADHTWLWQAGYGQSNQDLWDWLQAHGTR
jgi:poly(3-hydroxybutyrate) depolymerase